MGNFSKAIRYYNDALSITKEITNKDYELACCINIGQIHGLLNNNLESIQYYEKGLSIARETKNKEKEIILYNNIAQIHAQLFDDSKAIESCEKALAIAKEIDDKKSIGMCSINLGVSLSRLKDFVKSNQMVLDGLNLIRQFNEKSLNVIGLMTLGANYDQLDKDDTAIMYYEKALNAARDNGNREYERIIEHNIGLMYFNNSDYEMAYKHFKNSIGLVEDLKVGIFEDKYKIGFYSLDSIITTYRRMIATCVKLNYVEEAFEYVQQSKSRALLDLFSSTNVKPYVLNKKTKMLIEKEQSILSQLRAIQLSPLEPELKSNRNIDINKVLLELNSIYKEIEKIDPEYVFIRQGNPLSLNKIQNILSHKERCIIVEYFFLDEELLIFVVSSHKLFFNILNVPLREVKYFIDSLLEKFLLIKNLEI